MKEYKYTKHLTFLLFKVLVISYFEPSENKMDCDRAPQ